MEFSRPEYWSGYPFPSPGDLPIKEANGHRDLDLSRKTCGHLATEAWGVAEPSQGKKDWGLGNPDLQDRSQDRGSSQRGEQVRAWERRSPGREL